MAGPAALGVAARAPPSVSTIPGPSTPAGVAPEGSLLPLPVAEGILPILMRCLQGETIATPRNTSLRLHPSLRVPRCSSLRRALLAGTGWRVVGVGNHGDVGVRSSGMCSKAVVACSSRSVGRDPALGGPIESSHHPRRGPLTNPIPMPPSKNRVLASREPFDRLRSRGSGIAAGSVEASCTTTGPCAAMRAHYKRHLRLNLHQHVAPLRVGGSLVGGAGAPASLASSVLGDLAGGNVVPACAAPPCAPLHCQM